MVLPHGSLTGDHATRLFGFGDLHRLVWEGMYGDRRGIWTLSLSAVGTPLDSARLLSTDTLRRFMAYGSLPGMQIIEVAGGKPVVLRSDGTIETRPVPVALDSMPCFVNADTSVAVLRKLSVTAWNLKVYPSLFDTTAREIATIGLQGNVLNNAVALSRDSAGNYAVTYGVIDSWSTSAQFWAVMLRRVTVVEGGGLFPDRPIDTGLTVYGLFGVSREAFAEFGAASVEGRCDNASVIKETVHYGTRNNYYGIETQATDTMVALVSADGTIRYASPNRPGRKAVDAPSGCDDRADIRVVRVDSLRTGRLLIDVMAEGRSVRLHDSIAFLFGNIPQIFPALVLHDDSLMLSYGESTALLPTRLGVVTWGADTPVGGIQTLYHSITASSPERSPSVTIGRVASENGSVVFRNFTTTVPAGAYATVERRRYDAWMVTSAGWKSIQSLDGYQHWYTNETLASDPEDGSVLWSVYAHESSFTMWARLISRLDREGNELGHLSLAGDDTVDALLPALHDTLVLVHSGSLRHVSGNKLLKTVPIVQAPKAGLARCQRLLGNAFLRWYPVRGLDAKESLIDSLVRFERYGLDGILTDSITLRIPSSRFDMSIAQRRSDSAIAFLIASDGGVFMTLFDRRLGVHVSDSLVSRGNVRTARTTGMFKGDTLFAAWEDYRNGASDIYGNAITGLARAAAAPVQRGTTTHHGPDSLVIADSLASHDGQGNPLPVIPAELLHLSVYPVPASDHLTVSFRLPIPGDVTIELYDLPGRLVTRRSMGMMPVGAVVERWPLSGVGSGVYFLRLRGPSGAVDLRKIMLLGVPGN